MVRILAILSFAMAMSVTAAGCASSDSIGDVEKAYRERKAAWKKAIEDPRLAASSDIRTFTEHPLYQPIVDLGEKALPYLIADIEAGDMDLNHAVIRIAKLDLAKLYPNEYDRSLPYEESRLLVRWWKEKGKAQYAGKE